ncbi:uncharacterized protein LOC135440675 isoform X1 [Drosophila montana]|uniref:uncharacterized protein LOC135440675 isoform X1 n=1 Tax=Drosophila montana TaxID=40370 RepID=UPI00313D1C4B
MSSSGAEKGSAKSTALGEKKSENERENVGGDVVDDLTERKNGDDYDDDVVDDEDDDIAEGIAEDFVEYVTEYVGDDLIEGIVEKLTDRRAKGGIEVRTASKGDEYIKDEFIKNVLRSSNVGMIEKKPKHFTGMPADLTTKSAGNAGDDNDNGYQAISEDKVRENKTEHSVVYLIEYITTFVAEDIILSATDKVTQFATRKITERLIKFISEYVADDIIETVVKDKTRAIIESKTEQITDFIMGFISDNEILHTILNLSGLKMMRKTKDSSGALTGRPIDYLTNEFIQKYAKGKTGKKSRDLIEPLAEQLTESLANSIINAILGKLNRDTAEHLTDYVTEYVTEDLLEELCEEFSDDISKSSARTYTKYLSDEATVRNDDSDSGRTNSKSSSSAATDMWKNFTDEEYENGLADCWLISDHFSPLCMSKRDPIIL